VDLHKAALGFWRQRKGLLIETVIGRPQNDEYKGEEGHGQTFASLQFIAMVFCLSNTLNHSHSLQSESPFSTHVSMVK